MKTQEQHTTTTNPGSIKETTLLLGDCLDKLKELEDNSIDSIVSDPPYGLAFMGKKWDYDVPSVEIWEECMRVLKPGGHLLSFAGSRTYHRMAVRIEDAGFEIRDQIMWIYGSGFPKSHNISKQLDKRGGNNHLVSEVAQKLKEARESRGISKTEADKLFCDGTTNYMWFEGRKDGVRLPDDISFQKICDEWNELKSYQDKIRSANREIIGNYDGDMGGLGGERLGNSGGEITISATDVAKQWEGWGTALKPAHEPIVMARKPIKGTVADNVLEWGTGGINIDGCRIGESGARNNGNKNGTKDSNSIGYYKPTEKVDYGMGRFPANVIFECTCDNPKVVADKYDIRTYNDYKNTFQSYEENDKDKGDYEIKDVETTKVIHTDPNCPCYILDQQSGDVKGMASQNCNNQTLYGGNAMNASQTTRNGFKQGYNDKGGASRFFYCPKASKKDRDEGVEYVGQTLKGRDEGQDAVSNPFKLRPAIGATYAGNQTTSKIGANPNKPTEPRANIHPTVKPTDLMQYLIRLVTPKGGIVLDPFMGSGSTGKAAIKEGMIFVGIEREAEYFEIAQQRIKNEMDKNEPKHNFW